MTRITISLGEVQLSAQVGRPSTGRGEKGPAASPLPESLHALDLAHRLRSLIGAEKPPRLRLAVG